MAGVYFHSFIVLSFLWMYSVSGVFIDMEGLPDTGLNTSSWVTGVHPSLDDMWSLNDFQIAAKNVLDPKYYASYRTAALDEITYQANLNIWKQVRLNGISFQDVSNVKMNTTILGYNFTLPFFIAPAANVGHTNATGELSLATAAGKTGIMYAPSIESTKTIEEIAAVAAPGQVMFHQEYIWSNRTQLVDELKRIEASGFKAIFLTVDNTGVNGIRTRSMRFTGDTTDTGHSATFNIQALADIRNLTSLPIVPKGIRTAAAARTCLELGFPAIYVSNHGGRVVDGAPTAVEILLDIKKNAPEVFAGMEVYADGGVRRGSNVLTLLALGARAVGLGRTPVFSNIWGEEGVLRMINRLSEEVKTTMLLIGQEDASKLDATYINTKWVENTFF